MNHIPPQPNHTWTLLIPCQTGRPQLLRLVCRVEVLCQKRRCSAGTWTRNDFVKDCDRRMTNPPEPRAHSNKDQCNLWYIKRERKLYSPSACFLLSCAIAWFIWRSDVFIYTVLAHSLHTLSLSHFLQYKLLSCFNLKDKIDNCYVWRLLVWYS